MSTVNVLGSCSSMDDLSSLSKNKPRQDRAELKLQLPALHLDLSPTEAEELLPGNAWPAPSPARLSSDTTIAKGTREHSATTEYQLDLGLKGP